MDSHRQHCFELLVPQYLATLGIVAIGLCISQKDTGVCFNAGVFGFAARRGAGVEPVYDL